MTKPQILIIAAIVLAVITAAGGFVGGMAYAQAQAQNNIAAFQQQRAAGQGGLPPGANGQGALPQGTPGAGQFRGGANSQLGAPVASGQIKSVNGDTIEISTADSVVTVKVSDQTIISKTDRGALSDLKAGDRVTVFSLESGDMPTASGIQVQPELPAPAQTPQNSQ